MKQHLLQIHYSYFEFVPYVGTCVEINVQNRIFVYCTSRFLYGSVS
nr:MAG TPA_asm: hypothetical protein [Caudoviricetes sp.]